MTSADIKFIEDETRKLLAEEVIEPSMSPCRSQVLVTTGERHRKRLVTGFRNSQKRFVL